MVRLPFLAFFGSLLLLVNNALSVPSSSNGHFQQQQLPSYYHYGGEPANGDARRTDSEGDGRRQQQQQQIVGSRGNRRFSSDPFPSLPNAPTRKEPIMVFRQAELDVCLDLCELDCFQVFVMTDRNKGMEEQGTMWQCSRLKPPTRAFHEKVFSHFTNASPFDFVIFGLVLLAVLLCLLCGCYQCCCRQNPAQEGHHSNRSFAEERKTDSSTNFENLLGTTAAKANHLGNGGNSAERESLTNGGANQMGGDALIHPTPLSLGKNGGTSLSFGGRSPLQQHRKSHTFAVEQSAIWV